MTFSGGLSPLLTSTGISVDIVSVPGATSTRGQPKLRILWGSNQGLQFRHLPPGTGGTYRSARLLVREPPATREKDRGDNPPEKEEQAMDSSYPRIRVDFPRWKDGDPTG
ncbi:hypothetical protein BHM03_00008661 [Ensete ventricosum]|nr:hypothetical protein BHM03_00008661 [Ensete ventricosum]